MSRTAIALCLLFACKASAQNTLDWTIDFSQQGAPVAAWSTAPDGASCAASGLWSGDKGDTGTETLAPVSSGTYELECTWSGESLAEMSWVNPTQNTNGTPYENPLDTVLVWSTSDLAGLTCDDLDTVNSTTRPPDQTMHTITGLTPDEWAFAAFARNSMMLCSEISDFATKMIEGEVTVTDSITVTIPGAPSGVAVE